MYAVSNIEKFIRDHSDLIGDKSPEILERAREYAHSGSGLFTGSAISAVMVDPSLTMLFIQTVQMDPDHMALFQTACQTAGLP